MPKVYVVTATNGYFSEDDFDVTQWNVLVSLEEPDLHAILALAERFPGARCFSVETWEIDGDTIDCNIYDVKAGVWRKPDDEEEDDE